MFIAAGWGGRLREERERAGLTQQAFTHRNTQRAYAQETNFPDLRYVATVEEGGLDARYILTGERTVGHRAEDPAAALARLWPDIGTENCAALVTLARSLSDAAQRRVQTED